MHRPIQSSKTMGELKYWKIWADTQWVVGTKGGKVELPKREIKIYTGNEGDGRV